MDELLRLIGLWEERHSPLASYSKGMRQKILLLAALLHDPELLILDEPFSGLDVNAAMILRSLLSSLAARGKMILYSSHVLEVVEKVCNTVLILRKGQVVAHDSVAHLRELMSESSLEGVFAQLTQPEDTDAIAHRILDVVARMTAPASAPGWTKPTATRFELVRHFLARFFDNEMVSIPGEWQKVAIGIFAVAGIVRACARSASIGQRYRLLQDPPRFRYLPARRARRSHQPSSRSAWR